MLHFLLTGALIAPLLLVGLPGAFAQELTGTLKKIKDNIIQNIKSFMN